MSTAELPIELESGRVSDLHQRLLAWYRDNQRNLPWRQTRDPYRVLVSEVMLQQTQVDRVIPKYHAFLEQFPTIQALAEASTSDVIRAWAGLGYNRRAVNLQRTARAVVERYDGVMPSDPERLRDLPGIGDYTAGAVACFAYEQPVGFVDANIRRVLQRLFYGPELPERKAPEAAIRRLAQVLVPESDAYDWNQALIEFGALQCTSRKPACLVCPLQADCAAFPEIQTVLGQGRGRVRATPVETPFSGSSRYYRGRLIAALRDLPASSSSPLIELGPRIREDFSLEQAGWLVDLARGLERDGLLCFESDSSMETGTQGIAEERAVYDDEANVEDARSRLPSSRAKSRTVADRRDAVEGSTDPQKAIAVYGTIDPSTAFGDKAAPSPSPHSAQDDGDNVKILTGLRVRLP